jgi:hypothetical protein
MICVSDPQGSLVVRPVALMIEAADDAPAASSGTLGPMNPICSCCH